MCCQFRTVVALAERTQRVQDAIRYAEKSAVACEAKQLFDSATDYVREVQAERTCGESVASAADD